MIDPTLESPQSELVTGTYGPLVSRWVKRRLRMQLGEWQYYAICRILEHDAQGDLIARQVLISVGRQNGKSVIVRAIIGWMLDEGYKIPALNEWGLILLAAHDAKQARIPYDFIRRDVLSYANISQYGESSRRGKMPARATYYTGVELNGVKVDVASRQAGSTRGVSPGMIAFDEVLTQTDFSMMEVLGPALSAIKNSQLVLTSTAGFADSVVLRAFYDRLYRQSVGAEQYDPSFMGMWWMASDDDVGLDWEELHKANPGLDDGRLSRQMIASEYAILPRGSWIRERLNRWSDERVDAPFSLAAWGNCRLRDPLDPAMVDGNYTVGVEVNSGWDEGAIVVAAARKDGRVGAEVHSVLKSRPDYPLKAADFLGELIRLSARIKIDTIVYTAHSPLAPAFERHSVEAGLNYQALNVPKIISACMDFAESVVSKRVAHDDPYLDAQIAGAQRRFVGSEGSWRWSTGHAPIPGVIAMTNATSFAAKSTGPVQIFI